MDQLIIGSTGYPGDNDTWRKVNEMTKHPTEALAAVVGDYSIVSGVVDDGTNISDGYITYDGELIPFIGGASQPNVEVIEVISDGFYDNNTTVAAPIYTTRYARATANGNARALSTFYRIRTQENLSRLIYLGKIDVLFQGGQFTARYYNSILNVEREVVGTTSKYKITIVPIAGDYVPLLTYTARYVSPVPVSVQEITSNSFYIVPNGITDVDDFLVTMNIHIIQS